MSAIDWSTAIDDAERRLAAEHDMLRDALDGLVNACLITIYDRPLGERWAERDAAVKRAQEVLKATGVKHAA